MFCFRPRDWCLLVWIASIALASDAVAEGPRVIHFQGKLRNSAGAPVDGTVSVRFRLYDHPTNSQTVLFDELQASVTVENGVFGVLIGSATVGGVPDSALGATTVYLGVSINGTELAPRIAVVAVPCAREADELGDLDWSTGIAYPNAGYGIKEYIDQFNPALNPDADSLLFSP